MASYNAGAFVEKTLAAIAAQTHRNLEIIVVDDGSTDRTPDIVGEFPDDRIQLFRAHHQGAAPARNSAFRASKGDFLLFVDADDLICPEHITSLLMQIDGKENCIALSRWARFKSDPSEAVFPARLTERDLSGPEWLELDWSKGEPMTQSGMLLIPRSLLELAGLWNEDLSLNDDFEFFARVISRSDGVKFAPEARLYYRSSIKGSLSGQRSRRAAESAFHSVMLGTQHLLDVRNQASTRRICANILKTFEYTFFPQHPDLIKKIHRRIDSLGGADIEPVGPPRFHRLRKIIGWKLARRVQLARDRLVQN